MGYMSFEPKHIRTLPPIEVDGWWLKRYHVTNTTPADGGSIDPAVEAAAYTMLGLLVPSCEPDGGPRAGWMILHEGRDTGRYVVVYTWVWDNVVEVHSAAAAQPHLGCPDSDPTHFMVLDRPWAGCIWELEPFGHERSAWVRHVYGTDWPDLAAYLADTLPDGSAGQAA
jgi:hypothetical protein